jgi:glycosyltransferase involved in cell wall biosynthesis
VRNMAQYIAATLNSVLAQTWQHFKIVVLDDASTDNTMDIVRSFADPRISCLAFDENRGCNEAQNQMLARCETPFFAVLAADDIVEPTWLERLVTEFVRDPWLEFVACQTDFIGTDGAPHTEPHPMKDIRKAANMAQDAWKQLLWYGNVYFGAGLYRTYAAKDVGGWDTTVGCLGDYDMYLKLLQRENIHIIEENLVHTRIHDSNQSILKGHAAQVKLRADYKRIKDRYYVPRAKLVIATPFYEMKGWSPYISSLVATTKLLAQAGIDFDYWELSGDSYVERAKNTIMTKFLEDAEATHLLMIDSDMQWDAVAVLKMLTFPDEVVVGSYPQKNSWGRWTSLPKWQEIDGKRHPLGRVLEDQTVLLAADYLAGGFMMIKRTALEKFRDHFKDLRYKDTAADPGCPEREYICFSECLTRDGVRWGEDRIFGKRLIELGIEILIYPNINFGHFGVKGWTGNFHEALSGKGREQDPNTQRVH